MTREELAAQIIARCEGRIAAARVESNRAYKERDLEGAALCHHSIGENERAIAKIKRELAGNEGA